MQPPVWLSALLECRDAMLAMPATGARAEQLVAPHSAAELAAWQTEEAARRARLDEAVRGWLSRRQWDPALDATDAYLLLLRLQHASRWLELGVLQVVHPGQEPLLRLLLIDGWAEVFLSHQIEDLERRSFEFACGQRSAQPGEN